MVIMNDKIINKNTYIRNVLGIVNYADIKANDIVDGEGVCVSFWTQGCPFHCSGCHNPQTWDYEGGYQEKIKPLKEKIINLIHANGVLRNFSILGGEPLCPYNVVLVKHIVNEVRKFYPNIVIYLWTGYTDKELLLTTKKYFNPELLTINDKKYYDNEEELISLQYNILKNIDILITGRFEIDKRDITLKLRGSSNQKIFKRINKYNFEDITERYN